ncbi:polysaccharide deacetylase family protein [Reinekea sp.]|uniref:polysaccharide deacetylase family protein n=1 Tax=Reinekea sp. TaxID=1970455 RepID=UPI00398A3F82
MAPLRANVIPVFMLHRIENKDLGISGHSVESIETALRFINEHGYQGVSIEQISDALANNIPLPKNSVAFTLDDGFAEQAEVALPLFEKHKIPVTLFLATDMLDKKSWSWDYKLEYIIQHTKHKQVKTILAGQPFTADIASYDQKRSFTRKIRWFLKAYSIGETHKSVQHLAHSLDVQVPIEAPAQYRSMTWQQAKQAESNYVQFGPHTCAHNVLSQLSGEEAKQEIERSWQRIQEELSNPCPVFCYPTGRPNVDFGMREKQIVANAGFKSALSAESGYIDIKNKHKNDIYSLNRFAFPNTLTDFKQYCSWIERAKNLALFR